MSVSAIPGGNPTALAEPDKWALNYGKCPTCNAHWCEHCMAKLAAPECPKDKVKFTMHGPVPLAAPAPKPPPTSDKPWWKFWG
ncbi:MAG: hypothetical protein U0228_14545 [Myxococcaceae bacterium]